MSIALRACLIVSAFSLVRTTGLSAQPEVMLQSPPGHPTPPGRRPEFGINGLTTWVASATEFQTFDQDDTWSPVLGTPDRYLTSGSFVAPIHLPQGVSIRMVEIEGCDNSAAGQLIGTFVSAASPAGMGGAIVTIYTGSEETPGCNVFQAPISPPVTVDNQNNVYTFDLQNFPTDGSTYYAAVRVYYELQLSPPPAVPTFTDVPSTHQFYRFIEALYNAGVTVGCGGGNYCPDAPLTRAQAAAFISTALGLYWPN